MITFFTAPRPFTGEFRAIQYNALRSWKELSPHIILIGDDEGTAEAAERVGAVHIPEVRHCPQGVRPLVDHVFELGDAAASTPIRCYVNCDIILMPDFLDAARSAAEHLKGDFLLVGQRWDVGLTFDLDFEGKYWSGDLYRYVKEFGALHPTSGMDFFCYRGDFWGEIPPFRMGAYAWDTWLMWNALQNKVPVVDITQVTMVVHQQHKQRSKFYCDDANYNREGLLGKDWRRILCGTQHATWVLTEKGLHRR